MKRYESKRLKRDLLIQELILITVRGIDTTGPKAGFSEGGFEMPMERKVTKMNLQIAMYIILGANVNYVNLSSDIVAAPHTDD